MVEKYLSIKVEEKHHSGVEKKERGRKGREEGGKKRKSKCDWFVTIR